MLSLLYTINLIYSERVPLQMFVVDIYVCHLNLHTSVGRALIKIIIYEQLK